MQIVLNFDACHQSSSAFTPLMLAVQKGQFGVCKWLLENGSVDVNYKQHSTCLTALHFAVRAGNPELISLLMEHNADPGFCDSECDLLCCYKTPLVMAETEDVPNKLACVKSLRTSDI
ncbi:hypothetical protein BOX15_Mlig001172g3 [Macrostomum lignano]|uniref:Uncharacterized protein n=1 Tax=Macrostomum lignano TaxID=282301 RepID=A0A267EVJ9_9PLAT|nr:hypothetical protein BOX15_Mlig001172g9 [Macrostomum lignano]PAA69075.1 hypothetical protein BOX15_Mlig001172g3 [Macrostomum lignano]